MFFYFYQNLVSKGLDNKPSHIVHIPCQNNIFRHPGYLLTLLYFFIYYNVQSYLPLDANVTYMYESKMYEIIVGSVLYVFVISLI